MKYQIVAYEIGLPPQRLIIEDLVQLHQCLAVTLFESTSSEAAEKSWFQYLSHNFE